MVRPRPDRAPGRGAPGRPGRAGSRRPAECEPADRRPGLPGATSNGPPIPDRRSWLVSLTPTGRAVTATLLERAVGEREVVFTGFDPAELDALAAMLDRIDANVRALLE